MSHTYVPSPAPLPSSGVTLPDDADNADAGDMNVPHETLLNAVKRLEQLADEGWISVPMTALVNTNTRFTFDPAMVHPGWKQTNVTDGGELWFPVVLDGIEGALSTNKLRMTHIRFYVDGNGGGSSHGAMPATRPSYRLARVNAIDNDSQDDVIDQLDTASTLGPYETVHFNEYALGTPEVLTIKKTFYLIVVGESGANAQANAFALTAAWVKIERVP